jgi:hypothetical protein
VKSRALVEQNVAQGRDRDEWRKRAETAEARVAELQAMLNASKATELQLDARIRELTAERDAARAIPPPVPAMLCGKALECGGSCTRPKHHGGMCLCAGDRDGVPGTCEA